MQLRMSPIIGDPSSERSVRSGKTAAKVFKYGRESPWDATLNKPVPLLIRMLVCDWAQKLF